MPAKIMTARYPGVCGTCGQSFRPGTSISYGGKNKISHESCAPVTVATPSRSSYRREAIYGYNSWGGRRCEDAPCCGCCD